MTGGIEQPFLNARDKMNVYVVASPNIAYGVLLSNGLQTRFNGAFNVGYNIFKQVTLYGSYEVSTKSGWSHIANLGFRICL